MSKKDKTKLSEENEKMKTQLDESKTTLAQQEVVSAKLEKYSSVHSSVLKLSQISSNFWTI